MTAPTIRALAAFARGDHRPDQHLDLAVGSCGIRLQTNSPALVGVLASYFKPFATEHSATPEIVVTALERDEPTFDLPFRDWPREAGKSRRKEEYANLDDGRVVRKVRTGMQFVLGADEQLAIGPCVANANQIINFVNAQYMTWLLDQDWLLCHAAATGSADNAIAIAGMSGGGKSTLTMHLLRDQLTYFSNDRVLIRQKGDRTFLSGVPKLPRINPGTALHNPQLQGILSDERARELREMPTSELWDLEEKYDVDVEHQFGVEFELEAELSALVILNWQRDTNEAVRFERVDLAERPELLGAVKKSPGPFHLLTQGIEVDSAAYLSTLAGTEVWEVRGSVDFDAARAGCLRILGNHAKGRP